MNEKVTQHSEDLHPELESDISSLEELLFSEEKFQSIVGEKSIVPVLMSQIKKSNPETQSSDLKKDKDDVDDLDDLLNHSFSEFSISSSLKENTHLIESDHSKTIGFQKPPQNSLPQNEAPQNSEKLKGVNETHMFHFTSNKAGMDNIDKEKINQIVIEASKGSEYYNREKKKLELMQKKVDSLNSKLKIISQNQSFYQTSQKKAQNLLHQYQTQRNLDKVWLHIDMDMFFAAVEIRDNPSLKDKPIAVGGSMMISTTNYVARKYGVRSAMPGFIGKKLCPELIFISGNYSKYKEVSQQFMEILEDYDPEFESMGIDEASLDITQFLQQNSISIHDQESITKVGEEIRKRVFDRTQLTASCGIGANRTLAKICSDFNKPDGLSYLPNDHTLIEEFMEPLAVRKIQGIGKVGEQLLNGLGIYTCKDLKERITDLFVLFDESSFEFYLKKALGIGRTEHEEVKEDAIQKSISVSRTFKNISTYDEFIAKIDEVADQLLPRLQKRNLGGKTVTLEIKNFKFEVIQKSLTVPDYISTKEDICKVCKTLLDQQWPSEKARLMGIKLSNLIKLDQIKSNKNSLITNYIKKENRPQQTNILPKKVDKSRKNINPYSSPKKQSNNQNIKEMLKRQMQSSDNKTKTKIQLSFHTKESSIKTDQNKSEKYIKKRKWNHLQNKEERNSKNIKKMKSNCTKPNKKLDEFIILKQNQIKN